jgi:homoserine dehydrogenase
VLETNSKIIEGKAGTPVVLKYILDVRDFPDSPFADKIVHDFSVIENDLNWTLWLKPSAARKLPFEFSKRALKAGKKRCHQQ